MRDDIFSVLYELFLMGCGITLLSIKFGWGTGTGVYVFVFAIWSAIDRNRGK